MDKRTAKALAASEAKWRKNAEATYSTDYRVGSDECPLCDLFFRERECQGCPVAAKTGKSSCVDTPYLDAWRAWQRWGRDRGAAARAAAVVEADFLASLLPATKDGA